MELDELLSYAETYQPVERALPLRLQPFIPDLVPAIGAPDAFIAPPRPDGEPDPLGLTVLAEPAAAQSDEAALALRLRRQHISAGGALAAASAPPLGWVADPAHEGRRLDAWVEQVEASRAGDASAAALAPAVPPPDLDALMQAWSPDMQAQIAASPLPDPRQDVDLPTYARMCCSVLDLPAGRGGLGGGGASSNATLLHSLHALFALYLEFQSNPAFAACSLLGGGGGDSGGAPLC